MTKLKQNQRGAASMLVVIFMAIILTILTLGFIRLAVNEQRVATDDDLTTRAYYAAESGVEDAKRALKDYIAGRISEIELNPIDCDPPTPPEYDSVLSQTVDYDVEYTCQLIDLIPATLEYDIDGPNQTIQVPINSVEADGTPSPFTRIVVRWHINNTSPNGGDGKVNGVGATHGSRGAVNDSLPRVGAWGNVPAMLRMSILQHPDDGANFDRTALNQFVGFLNPNNNALPGNGGPFTAFNGAATAPLSNPILPAACDGGVLTDGYFCEIEFGTNFPMDQQYILRLTTLYTGTHVQVEIHNGVGVNSVRYFDGAQAVVDVTGRAGQVYRRVQTTLDLVSPSILPDAAITSHSDICKDFFITHEFPDYNGFDGTSCSINSP